MNSSSKGIIYVIENGRIVDFFEGVYQEYIELKNRNLKKHYEFKQAILVRN